MDAHTQEEMDEFLAKVNAVHSEVKNICSNDWVPPPEGKENELEKKLSAKKLFEQQKKERQERDRQEAIKKGHAGKGEKDNYVHWCRKCMVEYTIPTEKCYHCG